MIDGLSRFQGLNDIYLAAEKEYAEKRYENYIIKCRQVNEKLINSVFALTGDSGVSANGQRYNTHAKLKYIDAFFGGIRSTLLKPEVAKCLYVTKGIGNQYIHRSAKNLSNPQGMRTDAEIVHKKVEKELQWYVSNEEKLRDFVKIATSKQRSDAKRNAEEYQNAPPDKQQQMEEKDHIAWWKIALGVAAAAVTGFALFGKKE